MDSLCVASIAEPSEMTPHKCSLWLDGHTVHKCTCGYTWMVGGSTTPGEFGQYSSLSPEPIDVIESWGLDFHEAAALKYIARHKRKGGREDIEKAIWYLQRLLKKYDAGV